MRMESYPVTVSSTELRPYPQAPMSPCRFRSRKRHGWKMLAIALTGLLVAVTGGLPAKAEEPLSERPPAAEVTAEVVSSRLKELDASQALDDATKGKLRELYQQASQDIEATKTWTASAKRSEQMATSAPEELAKTKADLASLPRQSVISIPEASLVQLEQTLSQKNNELTAAKTLLADLEAEPKRRATRRVEIPKLMAAARDRLAETDSQLQELAASTDTSETTTAMRLSLLTRKRTLEQEIAAYQAELKAYDLRAELLPLRRDLAAARAALGEQELAKWREAINRQRQRDAEDQLHRAKQEAQQAHPAIADLTRQNAELAERRKALAQLIVQTTEKLEKANQQLATLQDQFTRTQDKVDTVGQTNAIGLLLRKQQEAMPDVGRQHKSIRQRQPVIQEIQLELLQLDDRRTDLADLEEQIRKELQVAGRGEHFDNEYELEWAARRALETEKEYLDALIVDLNSYFDKLIDLDNVERQLTKQAEDYIEYIDERVLWIRSTSVLNTASLSYLGQATAWLVSPPGMARSGDLPHRGCSKEPASRSLRSPRVQFAVLDTTSSAEASE